MKIVQAKDGSAEIIFSDNEIKVISEKKKFFMTAGFLKNFTNILMKLVVDVQDRFPEDIKYKESTFSKKYSDLIE